MPPKAHNTKKQWGVKDVLNRPIVQFNLQQTGLLISSHDDMHLLHGALKHQRQSHQEIERLPTSAPTAHNSDDVGSIRFNLVFEVPPQINNN